MKSQVTLGQQQRAAASSSLGAHASAAAAANVPSKLLVPPLGVSLLRLMLPEIFEAYPITRAWYLQQDDQVPLSKKREAARGLLYKNISKLCWQQVGRPCTPLTWTMTCFTLT